MFEWARRRRYQASAREYVRRMQAEAKRALLAGVPEEEREAAWEEIQAGRLGISIEDYRRLPAWKKGEQQE